MFWPFFNSWAPTPCAAQSSACMFELNRRARSFGLPPEVSAMNIPMMNPNEDRFGGGKSIVFASPQSLRRTNNERPLNRPYWAGSVQFRDERRPN